VGGRKLATLLVENGADVDVVGVDAGGNHGTPLWWAAIAMRGGREGGLELATLLLDKGADVDAIGIDRDGDKCTPLWWAARAVYYGRGLHSSTSQLNQSRF
jgi:hypothetical protein